MPVIPPPTSDARRDGTRRSGSIVVAVLVVAALVALAANTFVSRQQREETVRTVDADRTADGRAGRPRPGSTVDSLPGERSVATGPERDATPERTEPTATDRVPSAPADAGIVATSGPPGPLLETPTPPTADEALDRADDRPSPTPSPDLPRRPGTPSDPTVPQQPPPLPEEPPDAERPSPDDPPIDDIEACRNLGRVAIGDTSWDQGVDGHTGARFRSIAREVQADHDLLVCANPIVAWRDDLYVERLFAGGVSVGMLVSGREPGDPVIAATLNEWAGWEWRSNHNFVGVPTERLVIDGTSIIRTHRGGLVVEHPDAMSLPVVNGAWALWMLSGGPTGTMGMPVARAGADPAGGARQDFTRGRLRLPDITLEFEAEAQDLGRFTWSTWEELDLPAGPLPRAHSVIEVERASYYVGADGLRHWIRTTEDWVCAERSGAAMLGVVDGSVMASFPIGASYVCE